MKVHFIAIGGSAMHNLAIALSRKGFLVTGSDDEIFEPARGRLASEGLLPAGEGWFPERIGPSTEAVILGMHAKADNPELARARELGVRIFSYPEYLYEQSKEKLRVVIGGSHGKTTITAMILHVLQYHGKSCDFMVGAQLEGFDVMVRLTHDAPVMVIEGDEYLTSPIDPRPKFHLYMPDIALISGIAWDHINVFPTFENYIEQFRIFIRCITPGGTLFYCQDDPELAAISKDARRDIGIAGYTAHAHMVREGITYLVDPDGKEIPLGVFGRHNMMNIEGARLVCSRLGISQQQFYEAVSSFKGAAKRLELLNSSDDCAVYKDFAHAPSKVVATVDAVRSQYPGRKLVACLELHTYSSLSEAFLPHYAGTLDKADVAIVYFNPHALQIKRLPPITAEKIQQSFSQENLEVFCESRALFDRLCEEPVKNSVFLMMSSGNYDGIDLKDFAEHLCRKG